MLKFFLWLLTPPRTVLAVWLPHQLRRSSTLDSITLISINPPDPLQSPSKPETSHTGE